MAGSPAPGTPGAPGPPAARGHAAFARPANHGLPCSEHSGLVAKRRGKDETMATHQRLEAWVNETARLCQPTEIVRCDGSAREYDRMLHLMVQAGTALR